MNRTLCRGLALVLCLLGLSPSAVRAEPPIELNQPTGTETTIAPSTQDKLQELLQTEVTIKALLRAHGSRLALKKVGSFAKGSLLRPFTIRGGYVEVSGDQSQLLAKNVYEMKICPTDGLKRIAEYELWTKGLQEAKNHYHKNGSWTPYSTFSYPVDVVVYSGSVNDRNESVQMAQDLYTHLKQVCEEKFTTPEIFEDYLKQKERLAQLIDSLYPEVALSDTQRDALNQVKTWASETALIIENPKFLLNFTFEPAELSHYLAGFIGYRQNVAQMGLVALTDGNGTREVLQYGNKKTHKTYNWRLETFSEVFEHKQEINFVY